MDFKTGPDVDLEYIAHALETSALSLFEANSPYKLLGPSWQTRDLPIEYQETKKALNSFLEFLTDLYGSNVLPSEIERGSRYLRINISALVALLRQGDEFSAHLHLSKAESLASLVKGVCEANSMDAVEYENRQNQDKVDFLMAELLASQLQDEFIFNNNIGSTDPGSKSQNFIHLFAALTLVKVFRKVGFTEIFALASLICSKTLRNWYIQND